MLALKSWRYNLSLKLLSKPFFCLSDCMKQGIRAEKIPQSEAFSPLVVTPISQFDRSTGKMMHFVEDDSNLVSARF